MEEVEFKIFLCQYLGLPDSFNIVPFSQNVPGSILYLQVLLHHQILENIKIINIKIIVFIFPVVKGECENTLLLFPPQIKD